MKNEHRRHKTVDFSKALTRSKTAGTLWVKFPNLIRNSPNTNITSGLCITMAVWKVRYICHSLKVHQFMSLIVIILLQAVLKTYNKFLQPPTDFHKIEWILIWTNFCNYTDKSPSHTSPNRFVARNIIQISIKICISLWTALPLHIMCFPICVSHDSIICIVFRNCDFPSLCQSLVEAWVHHLQNAGVTWWHGIYLILLLGLL